MGFTNRVSATLLVAIMCAFGADIACYLDWMTMLTGRLIQVCAYVAGVIAMLPLLRNHELGRQERLAVRGILLLGGLGLLFAVLGELPSVGGVPGSVEAPQSMQLLSRIASFAWYVSPILLVLMYLRSLDRIKVEHTAKVTERTAALTSSNQRLQREIVDKMVVSNELYRTKAELKENTERTTNESENVERRVLQEERLGAIGQVTAGVSHELNNALMPIVSYSQLLLSDNHLTDQQRDWLQRINRAANDATRVVDGLQQFHTSRSGEGFGPCSPADIIKQAITATEPIWLKDDERRIRIETKIDTESEIDAEPDQICLLVTNLLLNAVDSIDDNTDGRVAITATEEEGTMTIAVQDNGGGMTPESVKLCFEPFYSTKHDRPGLGLSVSHGIARRHRGTFDIETNNSGTTIYVRFPISKTVTRKVAPETMANLEFDNVRILLVEDDESVRTAMTDILEAVGAEVKGVDSGPTALAVLETTPFSIMITDLGLAEMDGVELIEKARNISDVPIVLMSGWPKARVIKRLEGKPQPNAILPKPARFREVVRVIKDHARKEPQKTGSATC